MSEIQHGENFVVQCKHCSWTFALHGTVQEAYKDAEIHAEQFPEHRVLVYEATVIFKG